MAPSPNDHLDLTVLSEVAPQLAAAVASLAGDIALVIDQGGVIRNVALGESAAGHPAKDWVGLPWIETATDDTRAKIELLLQGVTQAGVTRRREVNHPAGPGLSVPVSYAAMRLGQDGPVLAVGRDLRALSAIQQRFVDAQHEMEREYWRMRQRGTHQRLLAQVAGDAVMVVDGATLKVQAANAAAREMFSLGGAELPATVRELLLLAARDARPAEVRTRLVADPAAPQVELSALPFRTLIEGQPSQGLLVRARPAHADAVAPEGQALAVVDWSGRVLTANDALRALAREVSANPTGRPLGDVLGDPRRDLASALAEARRDGLVHRASARIGGGPRPESVVNFQAALLAEGDQSCIGVCIVADARPDSSGDVLAALAERVGELALDDVVNRALELVERQAIEVALRRSGDDTAAAAALLRVSDGELALRMRRLGWK